MKLNIDCVRDILLTIEAHPVPMNLHIKAFCEKLPDYSQTEIIYCCRRLHEANYINLFYSKFNSKLLLDAVGDLTFSGHEFLEHIRNENVWSKSKNILSVIGSFSFSVITEVTAKVISEMVSKMF